VSRTGIRFLAYALGAVAFGLVNWFFRDHLGMLIDRYFDHRAISQAVEDPLLQNLILGIPLFLIWLLVAFVVIWIEVSHTRRPLMAALAVTAFWLLANLVYYAIWAGEIMLGRGLLGPEVPFATDPGWSTFWRSIGDVDMIIGSDLRLYGAIAVIGGPITGGIGGYLLLKLMEWWQSSRRSDRSIFPSLRRGSDDVTLRR
jgi:hypothetical protein